MDTLVHLNSKRIFTIDNAKNLLPLIYRITEEAVLAVKHQNNRLAALKGVDNPNLIKDVESEIDKVVSHWNLKLERLGVHPNGLWVADFDNGNGYFCWKYPEVEIKYHHGYQDGFCARILMK